MKPLRPRLSSAHAIALAALFVALGGTSWAALRLGAGAVKTRNIAAEAVTRGKLADGAVTNGKVKPGSLAANRLSDSARSSLSGPPAVLPPGKTVKGTYAIDLTAAGSGEWGVDALSFGAAMSSQPKVKFVADGQPAPASCRGTVSDPKAARGYLCIFESIGMNRLVSLGAPTPTGGFIFINSAGAGEFESVGSWAATAP